MRRQWKLLIGPLFLLGISSIQGGQKTPLADQPAESVVRVPGSRTGVCPPFFLRDEQGNLINPTSDQNADKGYSPRQTCGQCHDYEKITGGYHFTQGAGETPTPDQAIRCLWASTPGNYGGTWCSPAPLYRYLSSKKNTSAETMDMTSFSFITSGCGACHPGGGPAEFDRAGHRYDVWMNDPASRLLPGQDNGLDGDYYQARWGSTGVLEADCLLCHLPDYDFAERKRQLASLNFRWAASAAAGLASVVGSVRDGEPPRVVYNVERFDPDGRLSPHIVRRPRNETCLACHAKPGWKKRGEDYRGRTDVHLRAGLECVDCHPAASSAANPRIRGPEEHHIGKGDDPGGHVRDDLDDTCVGCADCHDSRHLGAPLAKHRWLPPLHLERIGCQTCHIPQRAVKSVQVVASDVFNPGAKIPTKGKHLWTFYGPDREYWNHYGDLEMMGYDDKPTDPFRPVLARYKGKIYPVNRIHSTWPAIEIEGETALMQPKMALIYQMWKSHQADPASYPALANVLDDNLDGVPEVNRPEEIEAIIRSVGEALGEAGYPMEGKRVVWVMDDQVYCSGTRYRLVDKHPWEASPYANVHKYSHGVYPAKAALGAKGCTDCHRPAADFFFANVLQYPFDDNAKPVIQPQYTLLGLSRLEAQLGAWREAYLKPTVYGLALLLLLTTVAMFCGLAVRWAFASRPVPFVLRLVPFAVAVILLGGTLLLWRQPALMQYMLPTRSWLDGNHFLFSIIVTAAGLLALVWEVRQIASRGRSHHRALRASVAVALASSLALVCLAGALILVRIPALDSVTRASYTVFDVALVLVILGAILTALRRFPAV